MWIHERGMSLHLLDLDQEIESPLKHDLLYSRYSIGLCQEDSKYRLEVGRKSWKDIRLELHSPEIIGSIDSEGIISEILKSHSCFPTLSEKARKILDASIFNIDIFLTCERSKYHKSS